MIYEHFRAIGAYETVQGLADLVSMTLQTDDVQDFDVRWDHALSTVSEMPSRAILEGLYKSKLQNYVQLQTVLALFDQDVARNSGTPQQLKTAVRLHIDQMMRNRNFRIRNDVLDRGSVTKSHKGNKACVERKAGECFRWKAHGQCSKGDSCSFSHDLLARGNKGKAPASHARVKQTDGVEQNPSQGSGNKQEKLERQECNSMPIEIL